MHHNNKAINKFLDFLRTQALSVTEKYAANPDGLEVAMANSFSNISDDVGTGVMPVRGGQPFQARKVYGAASSKSRMHSDGRVLLIFLPGSLPARMGTGFAEMTRTERDQRLHCGGNWSIGSIWMRLSSLGLLFLDK